MTLLFMDGADHVDIANATRKWGGGVPSSVQTGRFGGLCYRWNVSTPSPLIRTFTASASWVVGFAYRVGSIGVTAQAFASFRDGGTAQVELRLALDGTLLVTRNANTVVGGSSVVALTAATWYYIEWKVTIADSIAANSCQVRLNGTQIINVATGQDLKNTANASANQFTIGGQQNMGAVSFDYDDVYVLDQSGSVNNNFLGDMRVEAIYPTGAGATTAWAPSAGSNWQCVDEVPPTDDTDYVSDSTVGHVDTYGMGNLSSSPTSVAGVQTCLLARKDDAGARSIAAVVRPGSTDRVGATVPLNATYSYALEIRETNPDTSAPWTESEINGTEVGEKMVS